LAILRVAGHFACPAILFPANEIKAQALACWNAAGPQRQVSQNIFKKRLPLKS
jgi:hypothetical protein